MGHSSNLRSTYRLLVALAAVFGAGLTTSSAHAECVTRNASDILAVTVADSGWMMIQFPAQTFNSAGVLSVAPGWGDAVVQRFLSVAEAAFLSGSKIYVCRAQTSVSDPWGRTDRLNELRLIR